MTRTLLWMRHAKSSWKSGLSDPERPLNARGRRDAPRIARELDRRGLRPDRILCSDAERTRETRVWMEDAWGEPVAGETLARLYHASPDELLDAVVSSTPSEAQTLLVLSHNPGVEDVVERCTGRREAMPTGAVAIARLPDGVGWRDVPSACGRMRLVEVIRPRALEDARDG